jgi:hypothetical protein
MHGNCLCEVAEIQVSRVLAAADGDDEEDEEDEDEERRHDDEEEEGRGGGRNGLDKSSASMPVSGERQEK